MISFILAFVGCMITGSLMWWARDVHWKTVVASRDTQWQSDIATLETKHRTEVRRMQSDVRNIDLMNRRLISENSQMRQALEGALVIADTQTVSNHYFPDNASPDLRHSILQSAVHKSAGRIANKIVEKARIETEPDRHTDSTVIRTTVHLSDVWDL